MIFRENLVFFFLIVVSSVSSFHLYKGDKCTDFFGDGVCMPYQECPPAKKSVEEEGRNHGFLRCNFENFTEILCCPMATSRNVLVRKSMVACDNYTKDIPVFVNPQISNGEDAKMGEFPHMVALGLLDQNGIYSFDCGGTLISSKYVVTAAHCTSNISRRPVKIVRVGVVEVPPSVNKVDEKNDYEVLRVVEHPNYMRKGLKNDIALIELKKEVVFNNDIRPACLDLQGKSEGKYAIAGWGEIDENGSRKTTLQKGRVKMLNFEKCNERFRKLKRSLNETGQICAVDDVVNTCFGDSGGPLLSRSSEVPVVVGINSFGQGRCGDNFPTVYTRIYDYLPWIENVVWS